MVDTIFTVASGTSKDTVEKSKNRGEWLKPGAWGCRTKGAAIGCAEVFALLWGRAH
jgi:hypothetical protein